MAHSLYSLPQRASVRLLPLVVLLILGGCVWPMDPVPEWDFLFQGTVRRADTGAHVAGAQVRVRLAHKDDPSNEAPVLQGTTDGSGRYELRLHKRARAMPPLATVTVTPPAASGLEARTLDGIVPELFDVDRDGQKVTYTADFTVAP